MSYFEAKTNYERDLEKYPDSTTVWLTNTLGKKAYAGHYFRDDEIIIMVVPECGITLEAAREAVSKQFRRYYCVHVEESAHSRAALEREKELIVLKLARNSFRSVAAVVVSSNTVQVCIPDDLESKEKAALLGLFDNPLLTILPIDWEAYEASSVGVFE